eukprot:5657390-Alexandrium_andersonii.AAC.1
MTLKPFAFGSGAPEPIGLPPLGSCVPPPLLALGRGAVGWGGGLRSRPCAPGSGFGLVPGLGFPA